MQAIKFINLPLTGESAHVISQFTAILAFFSRLEEENQMILWLMNGKITENAKCHGHMHVVTTCMRNPLMMRGKRQTGCFGDR